MDEKKLEALMGGLIGHMNGAMVCLSMWLGDELGFYREMAGTGPRTADGLASKTGCNRRLVREWLDSQAAAKLVTYDPAADTYELGPEAALALADDTSPVFVSRATLRSRASRRSSRAARPWRTSDAATAPRPW